MSHSEKDLSDYDKSTHFSSFRMWLVSLNRCNRRSPPPEAVVINPSCDVSGHLLMQAH